ncbi:DUF2155 domain-containing protein [Candidatus Bandiella euplotis]|nr:DUF2155 domain-containing protein [Candidatus Bandiella woodruffii]
MEELNNAVIRLLNHGTGISIERKIKIGADYQHLDGFSISLNKCKKEMGSGLNPVSMASISVKNKGEVVFDGWIYSKNSSISLPKIDDYFIYLTECQK